MTSDLDQWEKAVEKATGGPWEHHDRTDDSTVASMANPHIPIAVCVNPDYGKDEFDERDGPFIAVAREALPPLLEIARLVAKWHLNTDPLDPCDDVAWSKFDLDRLDALLRKHTEVRE